MATELEVLGLVSDRLEAHALPFMLTGSFALAYYSTPRMTRDLDIVLALAEEDVEQLVAALRSDFYIDADAVRTAIRSERMFNVMHFESGIKVDLIVRKSSEYRQLELARRQRVEIAGVRTWIVSREDLILSERDRTLAFGQSNAMSDTSAIVSRLVFERHQPMTPAERWRIAASLFETARAIVESSLPAGFTVEQRRLAVARRFYGTEVNEAALLAHAMYKAPTA